MLLHHCSGTTDMGLHLESLSKISRQPPFIYSVKYAVTFAVTFVYRLFMCILFFVQRS